VKDSWKTLEFVLLPFKDYNGVFLLGLPSLYQLPFYHFSILAFHQLCSYQVEDSWKTLEFMVLPFKDYNDVFILGGTDDVQVNLDESNINIQTIASSRHVGPIKPRVDEWVKQLDIFSKTLVRSFCVDFFYWHWIKHDTSHKFSKIFGNKFHYSRTWKVFGNETLFFWKFWNLIEVLFADELRLWSMGSVTISASETTTLFSL